MSTPLLLASCRALISLVSDFFFPTHAGTYVLLRTTPRPPGKVMGRRTGGASPHVLVLRIDRHVLGAEAERARCPASSRGHGRIEGEVSQQRRGLCTSLLDRDRPAAEESLLGAGAFSLALAETCIRTPTNSEADF